MAINRATGREALSVADWHLARVASDGLATHPHLAALVTTTGPHSGRDLTDAVHLLCQLYGRHPGLIAMALDHIPAGAARDWLTAASDAFERERLFLVRLTAGVGPLPSTPGAADSEATLLAQRHALETLAKSERSGCALGAATALVADWPALRQLLDRAAGRVGMEPPVMVLPDAESIVRVIAAGADTAAGERALGFGGEQLLLQNRGLFDLLEARSEARGDY